MTRIEHPRHPLYIVSKGRYQDERRLTAKALESNRTPFYIIVEEQEEDDYRAVINDEYGTVLVLPDHYKQGGGSLTLGRITGQGESQRYDFCDEFGLTKPRASSQARNFAWDHAIDIVGSSHHWIMDDNINGWFRWNRNNQIRIGNGSHFAAMEDFVDRYTNIAMSGPNYYMFAPRKTRGRPFRINTRIYSCNLIRNDVPIRWRGRYNEDTILSIDMMEAGFCTVLFDAFLQYKMTTQTVKGGNTDEIYANGTFEKSQMLADLFPRYAKVVRRFGRIHHHVDYRHFRRNRLERVANYAELVACVREYAMDLRDVETGGSADYPDPMAMENA